MLIKILHSFLNRSISTIMDSSYNRNPTCLSRLILGRVLILIRYVVKTWKTFVAFSKLSILLAL